VKDEATHLTLYCDESTSIKLEDDMLGGAPSYWDYVGILVVPTERSEQLLQELLDARCLNPDNSTWDACPQRCRHHDHNNTEIHYTATDNTHKYKVACSWIDLLLRHNRRNGRLIYFYILGIDRSKLDTSRFGPRDQQNRDLTVYNRFFRTAILRSAKWFFYSSPRIVVDTVYHDSGPGEDHAFFGWHSIYRIGQDDEKLSFVDSEIQFIDSDHRQPGGSPVHSHFIQFIDLVLGCTVNCLHYTAHNANKTALALRARPLLHRIIHNPDNWRSRYNYYKRQKIEFFPRESLAGLAEGSLEYKTVQTNNFYTERELRIDRRTQPTLFSPEG